MGVQPSVTVVTHMMTHMMGHVRGVRARVTAGGIGAGCADAGGGEVGAGRGVRVAGL